MYLLILTLRPGDRRIISSITSRTRSERKAYCSGSLSRAAFALLFFRAKYAYIGAGAAVINVR